MNFYYSPLKKGFQMISRWIKINKFAEIYLILESKFEYDPCVKCQIKGDF